MARNIDSSFWAEQVRRLPALVSIYSSYADFKIAILKNLVESLDIARATSLTCVPQRELGIYEVVGESFPTDRLLAPRKSSELSLLSQDIILTEGLERYLEKTYKTDDEEVLVRSFQVCLPKYDTQHILVLTAQAQRTELKQLSDYMKQATFEYITLFTHIAAGMLLNKAELIEYTCRQYMSRERSS